MTLVAASTMGAGRRIVAAWLRLYGHDRYWTPSARDMSWWYLACLFGVGGLVWALASAVCRTPARRWPVWPVTGLSVAVALGPVLTQLTEVFVFTWPAALWVMFVWLARGGARAVEANTKRSALRARIGAFLFALCCGAFAVLCRALSADFGVGFLVGLLPAWPAVRRLAERMARTERGGAADLGLGVLAFTVYFWSSALFIFWRAG